MITLQRPDPKVSALLGKNKMVRHGEKVRPSQFITTFHLGTKCVIYNTLTRQCIESRYFEWFENPEVRTFDETDVEMTALLNHDFLVTPRLDESDRYGRLVKMLRVTEKERPGYVGYTILPTTACNARCVYCYQEDVLPETMNDEVVEQTIRYICKTRREKTTLQLTWFGGEPLLGEKIIDRICEAMREKDITYKSSMITNGSLITEELAAKAKEDWHLKFVQITLDGREDVYCDRKRYVSFDGSPYTTVLNGIKNLINQEIRVSIRLNVDEENLDEMMALVDELEERFKNDSLIKMYCHSIFEKEGKERRDSSILYDGMARLNERLWIFNRNREVQYDNPEHNHRAGTAIPEESLDKKFYDRRYAMRRYFCMVDSPASGGVITPNGDIYLCEHMVEAPVANTVFDEQLPNRENFIKRGREKDKKCTSCALLPVCTDFMSCPNIQRDCVRELLLREKELLRNLETEKKLPPVTVFYEGKTIRITEPSREFAEACTAILGDDYVATDEYISMEEAIAMGIASAVLV